MRELHPGNRALLRDETEDPREHFDVIVFPDAKVVRADAPLRKDRGRFGQDGRRTANRTAAEMDQVPVGRVSVDTRGT